MIKAEKSSAVGKIVYTNIQGVEEDTACLPGVQSSRQTEADVRASGLKHAIGRIGIYIEPDVGYISSCRARGEIAKCAGTDKCEYITRSELEQAYVRLLTREDLNRKTVNLNGTPITKASLQTFSMADSVCLCTIAR